MTSPRARLALCQAALALLVIVPSAGRNLQESFLLLGACALAAHAAGVFLVGSSRTLLAAEAILVSASAFSSWLRHSLVGLNFALAGVVVFAAVLVLFRKFAFSTSASVRVLYSRHGVAVVESEPAFAVALKPGLHEVRVSGLRPGTLVRVRLENSFLGSSRIVGVDEGGPSGAGLSARLRGQVSVEILLAAMLFAAFILLASNYAATFSQNTKSSAASTEAELIASQVSIVASASCVSKANVSFLFSCPASGFISISSSGKPGFTVRASGSAQALGYSPCQLNNSLSFSCASALQWTCFEYLGGYVKLVDKKCG